MLDAMRYATADIPDKLVQAAREGNLVIFAGAGVSKQSPLLFPTFDELVTQIKDKVDLAGRLRPRQSGEAAEKYLGYLESNRCDIRGACSELLEAGGRFSELHAALTRLFKDSQSIRIVTTNFDKCFENALPDEDRSRVFVAPALPLGENFSGVVHLHGILGDYQTMVLSAEDYGRAYVTNGWASRFLVDLFKTYTALFIGYSCDDSLVDYLTRSLSAELSGNAFALVRNAYKEEEWNSRGIDVISFDNYEDLPQIINELANDLKLNVLNRVNAITNIVSSDALSEERSADFVKQALTWKQADDRLAFTKAFCKSASGLGQLLYLEERNLCGFLTKEKLDESEYHLLCWAIRTYAVRCCDEFQTFCSKRYASLSAIFFEQLIWQLSLTDVSPENVGPWIAWLESAPEIGKSLSVLSLIEIADRCNHPEITLAISRILLRVSLSFKTRFFGDGVDLCAFVRVNDGYHKEEFLRVVRKDMASISAKLYEYCFCQIELAYSIQTRCWTVDDVFDSISYDRSSIAPHEQNNGANNACDVLLDVLRECSCYIDARQKSEECLASQCALLKRFGLWLLCENNLVDDALAMLRNGDYIRETDLHHEVFALLSKAYTVANDSERKLFVDYLQTIREKDDSEYADYRCFNICNWILESSRDELIIKFRDQITSDNPHFKPREHPDFTHYTSGGAVDVYKECNIPEADFSIHKMLELMSDSSQQSLFLIEERIGVPVRQYPKKAVSLLNKILSKKRTEEETKLARLVIAALPWYDLLEERDDASGLLMSCLEDDELYEATLNPLCSVTFWGQKLVEWDFSRFAQIAFLVSEKVDLTLCAEMSVLKSEPELPPRVPLTRVRNPISPAR